MAADVDGQDGAGAPRQVYRRLVDGGLLYDDEEGRIHHLNETAALIWEARRDGLDEAAITARLRERYEVDAATAAAQVRQTLQQLPAGTGA